MQLNSAYTASATDTVTVTVNEYAEENMEKNSLFSRFYS